MKKTIVIKVGDRRKTIRINDNVWFGLLVGLVSFGPFFLILWPIPWPERLGISPYVFAFVPAFGIAAIARNYFLYRLSTGILIISILALFIWSILSLFVFNQ